MRETVKKNMKHNKKIGIIILAIICYILAFGSLVCAAMGEKWQISDGWQIFFLIFGIVGMFIVVLCVYKYLSTIVAASREMTISEKDERNEMIRGKATINSRFVMAFLLLTVIIILAVLGEWLAVVLISIAEFIEQAVYIYLVGYYDKKY